MTKYMKELPKNARPIPNTLNWVDTNGNVYGKDTRSHKGCRYFKYSTVTNNKNGYVYSAIKYVLDPKNQKYEKRTKRVHILVAQAFIENPNNYPIVGHRNNNKHDNRADNLYWTTYKENTQKAVDDGLMVNDKGYDDSQSKPVIMFDTYTNKELGRYGSISIAAKETGLSQTTISRQAKYKKPVRKPYYFRYQDDETAQPVIIVVQYDFQTDKEIGRYFNTQEASRQTGICNKVIQQQCKSNKKPKRTKSKTYFLYK